MRTRSRKVALTPTAAFAYGRMADFARRPRSTARPRSGGRMGGGALRHREWIEGVQHLVCAEGVASASPVGASLTSDALASSSQPVGDSCW